MPGIHYTADATEMFTDVKDDDADASDDNDDDDDVNISDDADTQKRPPEGELLLYSLVGGFHLGGFQIKQQTYLKLYS